jgi:hypothetical protein
MRDLNGGKYDVPGRWVTASRHRPRRYDQRLWHTVWAQVEPEVSACLSVRVGVWWAQSECEGSGVGGGMIESQLGVCVCAWGHKHAAGARVSRGHRTYAWCTSVCVCACVRVSRLPPSCGSTPRSKPSLHAWQRESATTLQLTALLNRGSRVAWV